jgi:uncharacterized membrane protein
MMLVFPSRGVLVDAVDKLQSLGYAKIRQAAVVSKAEDGETTVFEDDISVSEGSIAGGTLGSLMTALGVAQLGAFLLPGVGPIIAIGAGALLGGLLGGAAGGITAGVVDSGFKNKLLAQLATRLGAGETALVVELEDQANLQSRLQTDLQAFNVEIITPDAA